MDKKAHWENIYSTKSHKEVSWFSEHVITSLDLIKRLNISKQSKIIDVGGGASTLVDDLLAEGYLDITVIDISNTALEIAKSRLENKATAIKWIAEDILNSKFNDQVYDLWHDRAVFHFLTTDDERNAYKSRLDEHLKINGFIIISVFADDGPEKCSALFIKRHNETEIEMFLGEKYLKIYETRTVHKTPANVEQKFINMIFKKTNGNAS